MRFLPLHKRTRLVLLGVVAALLLAGVLPGSRNAALEATGHWLVHEDQIDAPAYLAVMSGGGLETLLEIADRAAQTPAAPIVLFRSRETSDIAPEFARRGAKMPSEVTFNGGVLADLGVNPDRFVVIEIPVGGTNMEIETLAARGDLGAPGAVFVGWHHSARVQRIIRRSFKDPARRPAVLVSKYSRSWERGWWTRRGSLRIGLVELQKLALDVAAHPFQ